jgi:hypothetical protein
MHFALPGTSDAIVVLDWMDRPKGVGSWHPCQNLLRIRPDGSIVWQASLPSAETLKRFTAAEWSDGKLIAHTWSYECEVDPETGQLLTTAFTK